MPITLDGTLGITTPSLTTGSFTNTGAESIAGNLTITGSGSRFLADFTNATVTNRLIFQTSTVNSSTGIYAVPNGTGTAASWQATNAADPTNVSKILIATNGSTDVQLVSGINGTGTYLPLSFYTNGAEKMRLTTAGYLGIGTSSPSYLLQVAGSTNGIISAAVINSSNGASAYSFLRMGNDTDSDSGLLRNSSGNTSAYGGANSLNLYQLGAYPITFVTTNVSRMTITSAGNVGIGTASPSQILHVATTSSTYIQVQNTGNSINAYYGVDTAGGWMGTSTNHYAAFYTNNTERMRIDSSGNVGIKNTSPSTYAGSGGNVLVIGQQSTGVTLAGDATYSGYGQTIAGAFNIYQNSSNSYQRNFDICSFGDGSGTGGAGSNIRFLTQATAGNTLAERMRINQAGYVTTPYQPAFLAWINQGTTFGTGLSSVTYQNISTNIGSCYNTSNGRFTAPISGAYFFTCSLTFTTTETDGTLWISYNGDYDSVKSPQISQGVTGGSFSGRTVSGMVYLNAGDYVIVNVYANSSVTTRGANPRGGSFSGFFIG